MDFQIRPKFKHNPNYPITKRNWPCTQMQHAPKSLTTGTKKKATNEYYFVPPN